jgi:LppP/LprE lipoprotein/zinc-ribbon domain
MTASCGRCGAPLRENAVFCASCGAPAVMPPGPQPPVPAPAPQPRGSRRWTRRTIAIAVAAVVFVAGGVATAVVLTRPSHRQVVARSSPPIVDQPSSSAGFPSLTTTSTAPVVAPTEPSSATSTTQSTAPVLTTPDDVVAAYYDAVNRHDWSSAWQLGGQNFGSSYSAYVAGYSHLVRDIVVIQLGESGNQVPIRLLAINDQGQAQLFSGTYTVDGRVLTSGALKSQFTESLAQFSAATIHEQLADFGYTLDSDGAQTTSSGLSAFTATCTGSGDGSCRKVFFYDGANLVGVDTPAPDTSASIAWETTTSAAITYPQYNSGDPMCCPSGNSVTIVFSLSSAGVHPTTPLPNPINGR